VVRVFRVKVMIKGIFMLYSYPVRAVQQTLTVLSCNNNPRSSAYESVSSVFIFIYFIYVYYISQV
jgi:hypothetical protein